MIKYQYSNSYNPLSKISDKIIDMVRVSVRGVRFFNLKKIYFGSCVIEIDKPIMLYCDNYVGL